MDRHLSSVRDIEQQLIASVTPATSADFKSIDGQHRVDDNRPKVLNLQFDLIALALASGQHRVAFVQQGDGSDGINHVLDGNKLPNYHHISHRIDSDGSSGNPIAGAEMMHHRIDRLHMQTFRTLLDKLKAVSTPNGSLLDLGYAVWTNQQANGAHKYINVPYLIAGKAGGYLKTGQFVDIAPTMNNKLLNTLINAAGVRNASGGPVDDFGDGSLPKGLVSQIVA